jgi:hypothetical protein
MGSFLDKLPFSDEEKRRLNNLAVENPASLLSMIQANQKDFEDYFGSERTTEILDLLGNLISQKERQILEDSPPNFYELGAVIEKKAPGIKPPQYDINERNRLFEELQYWQSQDSSSHKVKEKISQLSHQLNELLNKEG